MRNHIDIDKDIIYVSTFYSKITSETFKRIKRTVKAFFFGVKVKVYNLPKVDLEQFEPLKGARGETYYNAAKMNTYFAKQLPKNTYAIAILTNLFIYNGDNPKETLEEKKGVFGLGSIKDRTCIISFEEMIVKGFGGTREDLT